MRSVHTHDTVVGIILAGGKSSRMRANKAELLYHGKRLIDHMADVLRCSGIVEIYVSGSCAGYASIGDVIPDRGPVGGILSVVCALQSSVFSAGLIVPVDMPLINTMLLTPLLQTQGDHDAVGYQGYPLPVFLRFSAQVLTVLNDVAVPGGNHCCSVKSLLNAINTLRLPTSATVKDSCFVNVNTPDEWEEVTCHEIKTEQ